MSSEATYRSGDAIWVGDVVRVGEHEGMVEEIITEASAGWADYWHAHGAGVMLKGADFGRLFVKCQDEELTLIRRRET